MSADMVREIATLRLADAEVWVSVVVHREPATGTLRPTFTVMADGMSDERKDVVRGHLRGIAEALGATSTSKGAAQ